MRTLFIVFFSVANIVFAVPSRVNFQGFLTDSAGTPLDTTVDIEFRLYESLSDPVFDWNELHTVVVAGGLYQATLGASIPIPVEMFANDECCLGIVVENDDEMVPRVLFNSVTSAFRVGTVDSATGGVIIGDVRIMGQCNIGNGNSNIGDQSFVAGQNNTTNGDNSSITGGTGNSTGADGAFIGSGQENEATGYFGVVGGGQFNVVSGSRGFVGGGDNNNVIGSYAVVCGGSENQAVGTTSAVGGGTNNFANAGESCISGGSGNTANGTGSTISGGYNNSTQQTSSTVGGGRYNMARGQYSVVCGGGGLIPVDSNSAVGDYSTVCGGTRNATTGYYSFVGGGQNNFARGDWAVIAGGGGPALSDSNSSSNYSVISGGSRNYSFANWTTIGGGYQNSALGSHCTIGGGYRNYAASSYSTVPGGQSNTASGQVCFAAGEYAIAAQNGSFVWSSGGDTTRSFATNSFTARTPGGVRFYTTTSATNVGVSLAAGSGTWSSLSDSTAKHRYGQVDTQDILAKVVALPIERWSYKSQDESIQHIGPMAQDFYAAFGVGENEETISSLDPDGVLFAAVQELAKKCEQLESRNMQLQKQIQSLLAENEQTELRK